MSFFKKRICIDCEKEYTPDSTTQKYCKNCRKENKRKNNIKALKKFREKLKNN
jgi:hypothetical protein